MNKNTQSIQIEEKWPEALRRMRDNDEFDDKFNTHTLEFIYAFQMGYKATLKQKKLSDEKLMEIALDLYCSPYGNANPQTYAFIEGVKYKQK